MRQIKRGYRKPPGPQASLQMLIFIQDALEYFARDIDRLNQYDYMISTARRDGLEGPTSGLIN